MRWYKLLFVVCPSIRRVSEPVSHLFRLVGPHLLRCSISPTHTIHPCMDGRFVQPPQTWTMRPGRFHYDGKFSISARAHTSMIKARPKREWRRLWCNPGFVPVQKVRLLHLIWNWIRTSGRHNYSVHGIFTCVFNLRHIGSIVVT